MNHLTIKAVESMATATPNRANLENEVGRRLAIFRMNSMPTFPILSLLKRVNRRSEGVSTAIQPPDTGCTHPIPALGRVRNTCFGWEGWQVVESKDCQPLSFKNKAKKVGMSMTGFKLAVFSLRNEALNA